METSGVLKMSQASRRLFEAGFGGSVSWVRKLVNQGEVKATMTPYGRLVDAESLEQYIAMRIERQRNQAATKVKSTA